MMELFWMEMRKIWKPIIVAMIAVIGIIYYSQFSVIYINDFKYNSYNQVNFEIANEWAEKYGPTIEPSEREDIETQRTREHNLLNQEILKIPEAEQFAVTDYESYQNMLNEYIKELTDRSKVNPTIEKIKDSITGLKQYQRVQSIEYTLELYDGLAKDLPPNLNYELGYDSKRFEDMYMDHVKEMKNSDEVYGYLPFYVLENSQRYFEKLMIWNFCAVILLLSPIFVRDQLRNMKQVQWSAKIGRKISGIQYLAGIISIMILFVVNVCVYGIPYLMNYGLNFRDFRIFSFQIFQMPWFNITFEMYLIGYLILILLLTISFGMFIEFLSKFSKNYISILLKGLPLFTAFVYVSSSYISANIFYLGNPITKMTCIPYAEVIVTVFLLMLSLLLVGYSLHKQKKIDLLA